MSTRPDVPGGGDNLQFERAEIGATQAQVGVACSFCRQPIADVYYQFNHRATCTTCLAKVREILFGGSGFGRTVRALLLGLLAAALGTGIYFGVEALTNLHIGLVAIVVGLLVGGAVRKGSKGRGGWYYQLMAIFLTYVSISGSYFLEAMKELAEEKPTPAAHSTEYAPGKSDAAKSEEANPPATSGQPKRALPLAPTLIGLLFSLIFVTGLSLALPILVGLQSPILLLITGFALFEAWRINKRPAIQITGPYNVDGNLVAAPSALPTAPYPPGTRP